MDIESFTRVFLALYFGWIALFYAMRLLGERIRSGRRLADPGSPGTPQFRAHRIFRVFRVVILTVVWVRLFWPEIDAALIPLPMLVSAPVQTLGILLLTGAFAIAAFTHSYMGLDWRSGVPNGGNRKLITTGPFGVVRNPMFVGVAIGQTGFFLAMPSVFSLLCLAVGLTVLVIQARVEERALAEQFGTAFDGYRAAVPAWVPDFGRYRSPPATQGEG